MAETFEDWKLTRVSAAAAAGTTAVNGAAVDMNGYSGVVFFTTVGTVTAGAETGFKVQSSSDNDDDDAWADLGGAVLAIADDADGQTFGIDVQRPHERYLRCVVTRAEENAVVGEAYALQYGARTKPNVSTMEDVATFLTVTDPVEAEA